MRDIARQLRIDTGLVPDLVDEYVVHTPREEAIKASRQVSGVTHYLSMMATGEPQPEKAAKLGVAITCIDEVTDELGHRLAPGPLEDAFAGNPPYEPLEIIPAIADDAADDRFKSAVMYIGFAQDDSLRQFGDIGIEEVERITQEKGGWSGRANLAFVKEDVSDREWKLMWRWGFVLQMLDDYLDQPKDREAGLSTPFTAGTWNYDRLRGLVDVLETMTANEWGRSKAHKRFFQVARLHRRLGWVENNTPLRASWFAPGYL